MYILLYVCIAVVLFSLGKAVYTELLKKKSKEHTTARFQYPEKRHRIYGRYAEPRWNPVYEYCVGQVVYKVEADVMSPTKQLDESDVEVKYLPSNPEICFINGSRGRILGKRNMS